LKPPTAAFEVSDDDSLPIVVLYGAIGDPSLCHWLSVAAPIAASKHARVVFRHFDSQAPDAKSVPGTDPGLDAPLPLPLSGYGVSLDVKNMEYKVIDDRSQASSGSSNESMQSEAEKHEDDIDFKVATAATVAVRGEAGLTASSSEQDVMQVIHSKLSSVAAELWDARYCFSSEENEEESDDDGGESTAKPGKKSKSSKKKSKKRSGKSRKSKGKKKKEKQKKSRRLQSSRPCTKGESADAVKPWISASSVKWDEQQPPLPPALAALEAKLSASANDSLVDSSQGLRSINHTYLGLQTAAFMWHATQGGNSMTADPITSAQAPEDPTRDPLILLKSLTGDFPRMAPHLQSLPVPPKLVQSLRKANRRVGFGYNVVLVNGRPVDVTAASFNYFRLLRTLQDEASVLASFSRLPLTEED